MEDSNSEDHEAEHTAAAADEETAHAGNLPLPSLMQPSAGEIDYASAVAAQQAAGQPARTVLPFSKVPTARKDEVQRLLGQCLVVKCDPAGPYSAPVVIMSSEEANVYTLVEKHFRQDYLTGAEKFWRLVRAEIQVETWRPRVQGTQLKALAGARLPETEEEFDSISRVVHSLQDCLKPESSAELFMQDLRITITQIQAWWENRNRRQDGGVKRGAATGPAAAGGRKRPANSQQGTAGLVAGLQLLGADSDQLLGAVNSYLPIGAAAVGGYMQDQRGYMDMGDEAAAGLGADGVPQLQFQQQASEPQQQQQQQEQQQQQQQQQQQPAPSHPLGNPLSSLHSIGNPTALLQLDVGGKKFRTTLTTLLAVQGSLFWQLFQGHGPAGVMQRLPSGELFIDRSGAVFEYVLEYLRACASNEATFPLPHDARELQALAREAAFYQLPGLLDHINATSIMPQPGTRTYYDSLYLETGFKCIEGPELREMERCKVVVIQQLNHVLSLRAQQGFFVDDMKCGVAHRYTDDPGGEGTQHNLYYNVLLKKVVPVLPPGLLGEGDEGGGGATDRSRDGEGDNLSGPEQR